jgi:hypothetical protein
MDAEIEPEIAEYPEAGPYWVGLWALARHWIGLCVQLFDPQIVASGLSRRSALRCNNWLWSIESLVRRLVLAAAIAFDVATLAPLKPRTARAAASGSAPPAAAFSVLLLPRRRRETQTRPLKARPPTTPPRHRHLGFPGDDLLKLNRCEDRRTVRDASRRFANPLHRRGPCTPWDPDYREDPVKAEADHLRHFIHGPYRSRPEDAWDGLPPARPERRHADRSSPYYFPRSSGVPEWKRIEDEWARVIPAPRLAARITALVRLMDHPERCIARLARRLKERGDLIDRIRELPPPRLKKPKLDRGPAAPLEAPLAQAHARLQIPDTS